MADASYYVSFSINFWLFSKSLTGTHWVSSWAPLLIFFAHSLPCGDCSGAGYKYWTLHFLPKYHEEVKIRNFHHFKLMANLSTSEQMPFLWHTFSLKAFATNNILVRERSLYTLCKDIMVACYFFFPYSNNESNTCQFGKAHVCKKWS